MQRSAGFVRATAEGGQVVEEAAHGGLGVDLHAKGLAARLLGKPGNEGS